FFSSRRRHTRSKRDWSSDVCSSDLSARRIVDEAGEGWLEPPAARALLEAYGVPVVPERLAATADEAVAAARELGLPVVVKTAKEIGRASCRERVEVSVRGASASGHR